MQNTKLYSYRYIFKSVDTENKLFVKYITDCEDGLKAFEEAILKDGKISACLKEYVSEIDMEKVGLSESVKNEKKEKEEEN